MIYLCNLQMRILSLKWQEFECNEKRIYERMNYSDIIKSSIKVELSFSFCPIFSLFALEHASKNWFLWSWVAVFSGFVFYEKQRGEI